MLGQRNGGDGTGRRRERKVSVVLPPMRKLGISPGRLCDIAGRKYYQERNRESVLGRGQAVEKLRRGEGRGGVGWAESPNGGEEETTRGAKREEEEEGVR